MNDLRRNHIKFLTVIIVNFGILAGSIFIFIFFGRILNDINYNYVWILGFSELLILVFVTFYLRTNIWTVVNEKYRLKISSNLGDPLPIKRLRNKESLHRYMMNIDYELFAEDLTHRTYYKAEKNTIRKMFGGYILKVVVYIEKNQQEFYLASVDEEVGKIQSKLQSEKKRVQNFLITQVKPVSAIDDDVKRLIRETLFFKTQSSVVSTINVALHHDSEKAVIFYSDNYSPSLYYTEQINDIKNMV